MKRTRDARSDIGGVTAHLLRISIGTVFLARRVASQNVLSAHAQRGGGRQCYGEEGESKEENAMYVSKFDSFIRNLGNMHASVQGDGRAFLTRILNTLHEMLQDRGMQKIVHVENVEAAIENGSVPVIEGYDSNEGVTRVFVHPEERVSVKSARAIIQTYGEKDDLVIVSVEGPTTFTKKECDDKNVQFLLAKDVCVNKSRHHLVPKHVRVPCPPPHTTVESLPKILDTDPIVQYYNFPKGSILKIERVFGGHETVTYFRVVVSANI